MNPVSAAYRLLNVDINPMTIKDMHALISQAVISRCRLIIASQNLHSIYVYHHDATMRKLHAMAYKHIDGMPLIVWGKLLGYPLHFVHRVTWVDWIYTLLSEAQNNTWRVFYLGALPEVAVKSKGIITSTYPDLQFECHHGYFNAASGSEGNEEVVNSINTFNPDILIVGMGMLRQEHWIYDNLDRINVPVILTCGAVMEYVTGFVSTPPRWMGRMGLEWLYRLLENPQRFWKRYLVEPWFLMPFMIQDVKQKFFSR
jgi:N-acetylglucosaminyldiphosphoundecaprenol N-acetyl-beta-D-mannosaminyltransferase